MGPVGGVREVMSTVAARMKPNFMSLDSSSSALSHHKLSCLAGAAIMVAGFSELRQVVSWLHLALGCPEPGLVKEDACMLARIRDQPNSILPHDHSNLSRCRELLYSEHPWQSRCRGPGLPAGQHSSELLSPRPNVTLHFEWKSFMWSDRDHVFKRRVAMAANEHARVVVVLGGGPHHFSRFEDHVQTLQFQVDDTFAWPQRWIDEYVQSTIRLFNAFGPRTSGLPSNVCVGQVLRW